MGDPGDEGPCIIYRICSRLEVPRKMPNKKDRKLLTAFCAISSDPVALAARLRRKRHTLVEYLSGLEGEAMRGKVYFDADRHVPGGEPPSQEEEEGYYKEVTGRMDAFMDILRPSIPGVKYVVAKRQGICAKTGAHKLSLRIFISGMTIMHYNIPFLLTLLNRDAGVPADDQLWDMSVYKREEQLMCAIGGSKGGPLNDRRVLTPIDPSHLGDERILDYVIQHVEPDWIFFDPGNHEEQGNDEAVAAAASDLTRRDAADSIEGLVACLGCATAGDRAKWIKVGMILKGLANGSDRYYPAWLAFSRLSTAKFVSEDDCRKTWDSLRVIDGVTCANGVKATLTIGTLRMYAKGDDPDAFRAWLASRPKVIVSFQDVDEEITSAYLVSILRARCPRVASLPEETAFTPTADGVEFEGPDGTRYIVSKKTNRVTTVEGGVDVGSILMPYSLGPGPRSIGFLDDKRLPPEPMGFLCSEVSTLQTDIASDELPGVTVNAYHDGAHKFTSARVMELRGGIVPIKATKARMASLTEIVGAARDAAIKSQLGEVTALFDRCTIVNNVNNGVINNISIVLDPEVNRHTDEQLIQAVFAANPIFTERYKFAPDVKTSSTNGIYVCDPDTNVWHQRHNLVIEKALIKAFKSIEITEADRRHVESRRGCDDMVHWLAGGVIDDTFFGRLDANLDLFALDNGVVDMRTKAFRPITPEDMIGTTAGWSYDAELAKIHRPDVEGFVAQVLPLEGERKVSLAYFSSLLSGRRIVRKLLIFTDRRSGANGKSSFGDLMSQFFGDYAKSSTKFVCRGPYERDRDSHGAGTEPFKGKRLVIAEELKSNMTLDVAMLKRYTGGSSGTAEDRMFGRGTQFKFTWQAGFLLIFNEGDCPQIDAGDAAFVGRLIVAPMRSKFVDPSCIDGTEDEHTFPMDLERALKFPEWRSALLDILLENFDVDALADSAIPPSMKGWLQEEVVEARSPLTKWLEANVIVTRRNEDRLLINDLRTAYGGDSSFARMIKAHFMATSGVAFKDGVRLTPDGEKKWGVIVGVVMRNAPHAAPKSN